MHGVILCLVVSASFLLTPSSCTKSENKLYLHYMVKCCRCHNYLSLICRRFVIVYFHLYNLECYTFWGRHSETAGEQRIQLCEGN